MSRFSTYKEELSVNAVEDTGIYATGENMKKYIKSMEERDFDNFIIIKSGLLYVGTDEKEIEIANRLGIGGGESTSDAGATVKEVQAIVDGVVKVSEKNKGKIPTSDTDKIDENEYYDDNEGLIGARLFDRSGLNLTQGTWNILIEYDSNNREKERYGSGYYWLRKGKEYTIKGEKIEFKNDYVINYQTGEFTVLSGRAVNWNVNATLGVPDKIVDGKHTLALNLDPMGLENGEWEQSDDVDDVNTTNFYNFKVTNSDGSKIDTGIQKVGDVEYDSENKSLKFNKNEENKEGTGGYLRLKKDNLDFTNGFTFEFYTCMSRLYDKINKLGMLATGYFCRIESLRGEFSKSMRFGVCKVEKGYWLGRLSESVSANNMGHNLWSNPGSGFRTESIDFLEEGLGKNIYLSITYSVDSENKGFGRLDYYVNGEYYGHTFYDKNNYEDGLSSWNNDKCDFFVGVCPINQNANLCFLQGDVYATRLYTLSLTPEEVKLNYDMTLKYRDSFKNE